MKKLTMVGTLLSFLLISGSVVFLLYHNESALLRTDSPSLRSRVIVRYRYHDFLSLLTPNKVTFDLHRNHKTLLQSQDILTEYWSNENFMNKYASHRWEEESILRFIKNSDDPASFDLVSIENETSKRLSYVIVDCIDVLLVFDLDPNSRVTVGVPRSKWQTWVVARAKYEDGEVVSNSGVDIFHKGKRVNQLHYVVSIGGETIQITEVNEK